jgi:hypothetical protein
MENEKEINLFCTPWDLPEVDQPTNPIVMNVSVVSARAVIKKKSAVRISKSIPKAQPIVAPPESLPDYHEFSNFIKTKSRALELGHNVIFFADINDEHHFMYSIECVWFAAAGKTEISILVVKLNNDLAGRLVNWDKLSEIVVEDLTPPPEEGEKKQSIASMQAASMAERRQKAVEIMNDEAAMDFAGPAYRRQPEETITTVTVWKRYAPLLLSLNSLLFTIDHQFEQIGRTTPVDATVVSDICKRVLEEHSVDREEESQP